MVADTVHFSTAFGCKGNPPDAALKRQTKLSPGQQQTSWYNA